MPLISDSTSIYVGNTEVSKVYAGAIKVWEKGIPSIDQFVNDVVPQSYVYASWPYEFKDCSSVSADWWFRYGYDTDGSGTVNGWNAWYTPGEASGWWFYSPQYKRMCMAQYFSRTDETLVDMMWYQVYDRRIGKTILTIKCDKNAPVYSIPPDAIDCTSIVPIPSQIRTQLPGQSSPRTCAAWDDSFNDTDCSLLRRWEVSIGYSDADDGTTQPSYWYPFKQIDRTTYKMIWPTFNAIVWSPEDSDIDSPTKQQTLWYKVRLGTNYGNPSQILLIPPIRYQSNAPFYPYPTGDGIQC